MVLKLRKHFLMFRKNELQFGRTRNHGCENTRRSVKAPSVDTGFLRSQKLSSVVYVFKYKTRLTEIMFSIPFGKSTLRVKERNLDHSCILISSYRRKYFFNSKMLHFVQ